MRDCWEIGIKYPAGTKVWRERDGLDVKPNVFLPWTQRSWSFTSEWICPGVSGVKPASRSEVTGLSSLSRRLSRLCSSVGPAAPGVLTNSGSRWSARGDGRLTRWAPRRAFRRACKISPSFGEPSYTERGNVRIRAQTLTPQNQAFKVSFQTFPAKNNSNVSIHIIYYFYQ